VPCCGTFCAFPWHISHIGLFVPCRETFCAVPWHILCLPMAHKSKSIFVPCRGTFCAFPWHIKSKSLFVPCCGTFCAFLWHMVLCSLLSRIASQELQVKNCKKSLLDSLDIFSRGLMNERIFSLVYQIIQTIQTIFYKVKISYLFSIHCTAYLSPQ
jgi:hypothetical protein